MDNVIDHPTALVPGLVRQLYEIVRQLEVLFPGRCFTPDGHLVGSIGEALAQYSYGLRLLPCSSEAHDAVAPDGRLVQIKATQKRRVAFYAKPDYLIALHLRPDGSADEIYNGPGDLPWRHVTQIAKNGQCTIAVSKLRHLMRLVPVEQRLPQSAS